MFKDFGILYYFSLFRPSRNRTKNLTGNIFAFFCKKFLKRDADLARLGKRQKKKKKEGIPYN